MKNLLRLEELAQFLSCIVRVDRISMCLGGLSPSAHRSRHRHARLLDQQQRRGAHLQPPPSQRLAILVWRLARSPLSRMITDSAGSGLETSQLSCWHHPIRPRQPRPHLRLRPQIRRQLPPHAPGLDQAVGKGMSERRSNPGKDFILRPAPCNLHTATRSNSHPTSATPCKRSPTCASSSSTTTTASPGTSSTCWSRMPPWMSSATTPSPCEKPGATTASCSHPDPACPDEAGIMMELLRTLMPTHPILGVCLGMQGIVEACGGTLVQPGRGHPRPRRHLHPASTARSALRRLARTLRCRPLPQLGRRSRHLARRHCGSPPRAKQVSSWPCATRTCRLRRAVPSGKCAYTRWVRASSRTGWGVGSFSERLVP